MNIEELSENNTSPKEQKQKPKETLEKVTEIKLKETPKPKPKRRPRPKPQPQIAEPPTKWKEKWIDVDGEKVLFVPSGFEIMTKDGWRPVMMRADKIQK